MTHAPSTDFAPATQKYAEPGGRDARFHPGWWILPGVLLVIPFWVAFFRGFSALVSPFLH
ncbi:hypothetical protein [Aliiroseovarius lamellibrachiae]|uniref:hypothetical protein n=1 Tax=Aliiroseovarius lamellibrachiae TaxID=1924933 RepID=UPI001BE0D2C1|nr:hypothetical protein [Aliiroseovarius lamellibrachiae]MBT2131745.1 hypothetical protein [Aliiroseovarius lamellibrachiae]